MTAYLESLVPGVQPTIMGYDAFRGGRRDLPSRGAIEARGGARLFRRNRKDSI